MLDELHLPYDDTSVKKGRHRRRRKEGRGGRSFVALIVVLGVFAALVLGVGWGWGKISGLLSAPDYPGPGSSEEVVVQIKKGDTAGDIGNTLVKQDVVKSAKAFVNAANEDNQSRKIQPGYYKVRKQMKAKDALTALLDLNNKQVVKTTVPEGLSNIQTFQKLSKDTKIPVQDFVEAAKDVASFDIPDWWFKVTVPDNKRPPKTRSIEGFLFPQTYEFNPGVTASDILQRMVDTFKEVVGELGFVDQVQAKRNITPYEGLIAASLIDDEGIPEDYTKIARVIINRVYKKDMALQFDSTSQYWLERQGQPRKARLTQADNHNPGNPYNTYDVKGLPPNPIANPSKEALAAMLNPAEGEWLYFVVVDKNGKSAFAVTLAEHERNIAVCRAKNLGC